MSARIRRYVAYATVLLVVVALFNFGATPPKAYSIDLGDIGGDILKTAGIGVLVNQFAGEINKGINDILMKEDVMPTAETAVVPIVKIGTESSTAVGAAQIVGPPSQVDKVEAVGQGNIRIGGLQGRLLIPVTTKSVETESIKGVGGVGVSANIKFNL